jgi:hypothetical protein
MRRAGTAMNAALNRLTHDLQILVDWRDQLSIQIKRAELLFDLGLLTETHLDGITRRVGFWREAAKALGERIPDSLVDAGVQKVTA